jgi:hypothetical protein
LKHLCHIEVNVYEGISPNVVRDTSDTKVSVSWDNGYRIKVDVEVTRS